MWSGGVFSRANGSSEWQDNQAGGIGIVSALHDAQDNDLATGINNCLTKDGQNTATANLPMGGYKHTNIGNATARAEYVSLGQLVDGASTKVASLGGTANALTLTVSPAIPAYVAGQEFLFIASAPNTGATTVNVSALGTRNIIRPGSGSALYVGDLISGILYHIVYDGTSFVLMNCVPSLNAWIPTCTTATGVLSSVSTDGLYVVGLNNLVQFELFFSGTLSGGPASIFGFTLPVTATPSAVNRSGFNATGNNVTTRTVAIGYLNSVTVGYISQATTAWANGTATAAVSGFYRAA